MADHQNRGDENDVETSEISHEKLVLDTGITGKVKWFNVKLRYGFVNRNDTHEDIFIHQSAIAKGNPNHPRKSVEDGEEILFDVVKGIKGNEVANVCAVDGNCVKGSEYALRFPRIRRGNGRGRGRGRTRSTSSENGVRTQDYYRGGSRGRPYRDRPIFSRKKVKSEDQEVPDVAVTQKETLFTGITGKVKWFNVKRGYGFVCRNDNQEDIFIHHSAISKSNPEHPRKSVEDGEDILFDVVQGSKGNEAANVSAADGNCVKGSEYALRYNRGWGRGKGRGRGGGGRGRSRETSENQDVHPQESFRGDSGGRPFRGKPPFLSRRPFRSGRPFRGGPYVMQYRGQYNYEMPREYFYEYDYYPEPMRGPPMRGGFDGRMFRGGPRDVPMKFDSYENEFYDRRGRGRGRSRGRGRGRARGGQGNNSKPDENDVEGDNHSP